MFFIKKIKCKLFHKMSENFLSNEGISDDDRAG